MKRRIDTFVPQKTLLMGAAPSEPSERVLTALSRPVLSHLDVAFIDMMQELRFLIQYLFQTKNELTFPIPGPASAAMEACFLNIIEENDEVIVCENGLYGERMSDLLRLYKANVIPVSHEWGDIINLDMVEKTLKKHRHAKALCAVHGESSTGVLSDIAALGALCQKYGVLLIVDVVCSTAGNPLKVDEWGLDIAYCNTHKCVGAVPGLAPITVSERAIEIIRQRKNPVRSYFLNFNLIMQHWYKQDKIFRTYHHTAPVNALYGLHEALLMIYEEGLENLQHRYQTNSKILTQGLEKIGLEMPISSEKRIPTLNVIKVPSHWDQRLIIDKLYQRHNIQISGGLGKWTDSTLRVAAMGNNNNRSAIEYTLDALADVLNIKNW